jgi:signal transduction histidine kinase
MIDKIKIETGAGCYLDDLKKEMKTLSNKYRCEVTATFNGDVISTNNF